MHTVIKFKSFLVYAFSILFIGQSTYCTIQQPQAPEWEVPLTIPIVNSTYLATDLADDIENLKILENNNLGFSIAEQMDTMYVNDFQVTNHQSYSTAIELGNFKINIDETIQDSSITLGQVWPAAQQNSGAYVPIPAFTFNQVSTEIIIFDEFEYVDIIAGQATVAITNRFPFPIGPLNLLIRDANQNQIVQIYFPNIIQSGGAYSQIVDLAGLQIINEMQAEISGQSIGSNGETIFIDQEDDIIFQISFNELTVSHAKAIIEPIEVNTSDLFDLFDNFFISTAHIQSGQLQINLKNNIPMDLSLSLEFPEILNQAGTNLKVAMDIPSGGERNSEINLSGHRILLPQVSQQLTVLVNARFQNNGSEYTEISNHDNIELSVDLNDFTVQYFKGIISPTKLDFPSTTTHLDLPDDLDKLQFQYARLSLNFHNRINFPINLSLQLKGSNMNGNPVLLPVDVSLDPSGGNSEKITTIYLDKNNSAIVDFINNIPTHIEISGTAEFGDGITSGSVSFSDYIFVDYQIDAPFHVSFDQQIIYPDTNDIIILPKDYPSEDFNGKSTIEGELTQNLQHGDIFLTIHNHFPVACEIKINVSDTLASLNTNPSLIIGPIEISRGQIDENGQVQQELVSSHQVSLSAEQMAIFKNNTGSKKTLYFQPEIVLQSSNIPIILNADDFISIISQAKFNILVSPK